MRGRMPRAIVVPKFLPYAKELAYIQSSGTQYINTDFKPNSNTRVDVSFQSDSTSMTIIGSDSGWRKSGFGIYNSIVQFGISTYSSTLNGNSSYTVSIDKGIVKINGAVKSTFDDSFSGAYPLTIFANNRNGKPAEFSTTKLYSCQIYDNGTLVRDFIPVMDYDGVACLYEKVEMKLYYNAGSGAFSYAEVA